MVILVIGVFILIDLICGQIGTALGIQMYMVIGICTAGILGTKHLIICIIEEARDSECIPVYIPLLIEQIDLEY